MLDGEEFFSCECGSDEHTLRFILDLDEQSKDPHPELYTTVFLNQWRPWYLRVWIGIKYIFGYKCKYGHWDSFSMNDKDAERLISLVNQFVTARHKD